MSGAEGTRDTRRQALVRMPKPTTVKLTDINPHIVCPLCSGYLIEATTIMECLHSFCRCCIIRYLGCNKFCPVCDVQVHKTRPLSSLRSDSLLQDLVYKLVPNLYKDEMHRRREFWRNHPDAAGSHTSPESTSRGEVLEYRLLFSQQEKISLVLQHYTRSPERHERKLRNECQKSDDKRYLLCPSQLNIAHLRKFIRSKFDLGITYDVELLYCGKVLQKDVTLMEIAYIFGWSKVHPLKLHYLVTEKRIETGTKHKIDQMLTASKHKFHSVKSQGQPNGRTCRGKQTTLTSSSREKKLVNPGTSRHKRIKEWRHQNRTKLSKQVDSYTRQDMLAVKSTKAKPLGLHRSVRFNRNIDQNIRNKKSATRTVHVQTTSKKDSNQNTATGHLTSELCSLVDFADVMKNEPSNAGLNQMLDCVILSDSEEDSKSDVPCELAETSPIVGQIADHSVSSKFPGKHFSMETDDPINISCSSTPSVSRSSADTLTSKSETMFEVNVTTPKRSEDVSQCSTVKESCSCGTTETNVMDDKITRNLTVTAGKTECLSDVHCDTESCHLSLQVDNNSISVERNNNDIPQKDNCLKSRSLYQTPCSTMRNGLYQTNEEFTVDDVSSSQLNSRASSHVPVSDADKTGPLLPSKLPKQSFPASKTKLVLTTANQDKATRSVTSTAVSTLKYISTQASSCGFQKTSNGQTNLASFLQIPKLAFTGSTPLKIKMASSKIKPQKTKTPKTAMYAGPVSFTNTAPIKVISTPVTAFLPVYTNQTLQQVLQIPVKITKKPLQNQPKSGSDDKALCAGGTNSSSPGCDTATSAFTCATLGSPGKPPPIINRTPTKANSPICMLAQFTLSNSDRLANAGLYTVANTGNELKDINSDKVDCQKMPGVTDLMQVNHNTTDYRMASNKSASSVLCPPTPNVQTKLKIPSSIAAVTAADNKHAQHTSPGNPKQRPIFLSTSLSDVRRPRYPSTTITPSISQMTMTPCRKHVSSSVPRETTDGTGNRNTKYSGTISSLVTLTPSTTIVKASNTSTEAATMTLRSTGVSTMHMHNSGTTSDAKLNTCVSTLNCNITTSSLISIQPTDSMVASAKPATAPSKPSRHVPIQAKREPLPDHEVTETVVIESADVRPVAPSIRSKSTVPDDSTNLMSGSPPFSKTTPVVDVNKTLGDSGHLHDNKPDRTSCSIHPATRTSPVTTAQTATLNDTMAENSSITLAAMSDPRALTSSSTVVTSSTIQAPILKEALSRPIVRATTTQGLLSPRKKYTPMKLGPSGPILPQIKNCVKQEIVQAKTHASQFDDDHGPFPDNNRMLGADKSTTVRTESQESMPTTQPQSTQITRSMSCDPGQVYPETFGCVKQTLSSEGSSVTNLSESSDSSNVPQQHHSPTRKVPDYTRYRECVVTTKLASHRLGKEHDVYNSYNSPDKDVYNFEDTPPSVAPTSEEGRILCKDDKTKNKVEKKCRKRKMKKLEPLPSPQPNSLDGNNKYVTGGGSGPKVTFEILTPQEAEALDDSQVRQNIGTTSWGQNQSVTTPIIHSHDTDISQQAYRATNQRSSVGVIPNSSSSSVVTSIYSGTNERHICKERSSPSCRQQRLRYSGSNSSAIHDKYKNSKLFRALSQGESYEADLWDGPTDQGEHTREYMRPHPKEGRLEDVTGDKQALRTQRDNNVSVCIPHGSHSINDTVVVNKSSERNHTESSRKAHFPTPMNCMPICSSPSQRQNLWTKGLKGPVNDISTSQSNVSKIISVPCATEQTLQRTTGPHVSSKSVSPHEVCYVDRETVGDMKNEHVKENVSKSDEKFKEQRSFNLPRPCSAPPLQKSTPLHKQLYPHPERLLRNNMRTEFKPSKECLISTRPFHDRNNQGNTYFLENRLRDSEMNMTVSARETGCKSPIDMYSPVTPDSSPGIPSVTLSQDAAAAAVSLVTMGMGGTQKTETIVGHRQHITGVSAASMDVSCHQQIDSLPNPFQQVNQNNIIGTQGVPESRENINGKQDINNQTNMTKPLWMPPEKPALTKRKCGEVETPPIKKLKLMCNGISFDPAVEVNNYGNKTCLPNTRCRKLPRNNTQATEFMGIPNATSNAYVQDIPVSGLYDGIYVKSLTNGHNFPHVNHHATVSSPITTTSFCATLRGVPYSFCQASTKPMHGRTTYTSVSEKIQPVVTIPEAHPVETLRFSSSFTTTPIPTDISPPSIRSSTPFNVLPSMKCRSALVTGALVGGYDQPLELTTKTAQDRHKERQNGRDKSSDSVSQAT